MNTPYLPEFNARIIHPFLGTYPKAILLNMLQMLSKKLSNLYGKNCVMRRQTGINQNHPVIIVFSRYPFLPAITTSVRITDCVAACHAIPRTAGISYTN